jgi:hypothetical protein
MEGGAHMKKAQLFTVLLVVLFVASFAAHAKIGFPMGYGFSSGN